MLVGTPGATPLFTIADQKRLRIYVRVPQTDAAAVQPGMTATFTVPEMPGRNFTATLAASACGGLLTALRGGLPRTQVNGAVERKVPRLLHTSILPHAGHALTAPAGPVTM